MAGSVFIIVKTFVLFFITAIFEIVGCYLPNLILTEGKSKWLWIPTFGALMVFVWLLTLHPAASGRIYAAYGGIYITTALAWLRVVDGVTLTKWDVCGVIVVIIGACIIILQPGGVAGQ